MKLADDVVSLDDAVAYYFECLDRGGAVDEASLLSRFPRHAAELGRFFADQRQLNARVRELRSEAGPANRLSIRCPNCHQHTEIAVDSTLSDIECGSCASHFALVDESASTSAMPSMLAIGRFRLSERLGMGAYGSVWKARDDALDRTVAVKIPRQGGMTTDDQEKFFREARAAAQLRHSNIVSIHEVGREGDTIYIVSDFVQGITLGDWLEGRQPSAREAAELCVIIAGALHHAHEFGVVHRDLKPANIIMDVEGRPHLMDFGLARRDVGEVTVTMDGQVLGTPAYMSPEQAEGRAHAADRRSDVYSLGVILFQLLTGELPFRGTARMLMHQVIHDEPPGARKFNASVPKDLETIVGKAMEKAAADRYASARELADDLRRYLDGKPIKARPTSPAEKLVKWSRRHRTIVGVVAAAAVVLTAVLVASFVLVNKERVTALAALEETSELLYTSDMNAAYDAWDQGWSDEAQTILARQMPKVARPDQRGLEWFLLDRMTRPPVPTVLAGHDGAVNEIAVFPDRRSLASVGDDGTLRIWDLASKTAKTIQLTKVPLYSVAISPDGRYVAAGSWIVYLYDLHASTARPFFQGEYNFESLAFSADGKRLAAGQRYDNVCLLSLEGEVIQQALFLAPPSLCSTLGLLSRAGQVIQRVACASRVESLEFVPGQPQLLIPNRRKKGNGAVFGTGQLWSEDLSAVEGEFRPHLFGVKSFRSSPCGNYIAATGEQGSKTYVFHRASGQVALQTRDGRDVATAIGYSPDGGTIAVGYSDGIFEYFSVGRGSEMELFTNRPRRAIDAHRAKISDVKFIAPEIVATCAADGLIKIWDLSQTVNRLAPRGDSELLEITLSSDGKLLACVSRKNLTLLDVEGASVAKETLDGASGKVAWSPSGKWLAMCCFEKGSITIHDTSLKNVATSAHEGTPRAIAFSPDERMLAAIGSEHLQVYRAKDGREIHRQPLSGEGGHALAFSPDGRHLAYGGKIGAIVLADSAGKRIQHELVCDSHTLTLTFSPDSSMLASGHFDSVIRLWSVKDGVLKVELAKHGQAVESLAFSTDGRTLVSGGHDGTIRMWSIGQSRHYGIAHRVIPQDEAPYAGLYAAGASISSDGRRLAITYRDRLDARTVELWDLLTPPPTQ